MKSLIKTETKTHSCVQFILYLLYSFQKHLPFQKHIPERNIPFKWNVINCSFAIISFFSQTRTPRRTEVFYVYLISYYGSRVLGAYNTTCNTREAKIKILKNAVLSCLYRERVKTNFINPLIIWFDLSCNIGSIIIQDNIQLRKNNLIFRNCS